MEQDARAEQEAAQRAARNRHIMALNRIGKKKGEIARIVGVSRQQVCKVVLEAEARRLNWRQHPDPPIADLPIEKRVRNALTKCGIKRLSEIINMPQDKMMRLPNLGPKTVSEIRTFLDSFGRSAR